MSEQRSLEFNYMNPALVQRILHQIQESYPHMAKSVITFYIIVDSTCARIGSNPPVFKLDDTQYYVMVRGIEPMFRALPNDGGAIIGVNVFVGVMSDYMSKPTQAGQIRILLGNHGDSEYTPFLYLDLNSDVIRSDRQIIHLTEWIISLRHLLEQEITATASQGRNQGRTVHRPKQSQQPMNQSQPSSQVNSQTPPKAAPSMPARPNTQPIPNTNNGNNGTPMQSRQDKKQDPLQSIAKEDIPPFEIKTATEKINVPKDLFELKEKKK